MSSNDRKTQRDTPRPADSGHFETAESGASIQDNRPEVQQHRQRQAAANQSPQVNNIVQLQSAANNFTGGAVQRDETDSESESGPVTAPTTTTPAASGAPTDEDGFTRADGVDAELGADTESLSWFRSTFVSTKEQLTRAEQDAAQLDLVLKSIHREYGQWFGNAHSGDPDTVPARSAAFKALENQLVGGSTSFGKFWSLVDGFEEVRQDMAILVAGVRSDFEGVTSYFESSLNAVQSNPGTIGLEHASGLWEHAKTLSAKALDDRSKTLFLLHEAETMLESGRTQFGGSVATKPIAIDKESITEARTDAGSTDPVTSLHQNDGPGMALASLKKCMVDYVRATREKEALRSSLGVSKLKKVSKAKRASDPTADERIDTARRNKTQAKEKFDTVRKAVQGMLDKGLSPEITTEIAEIDRTYLGLTAEEADAHISHVETDRLGKLDKASTLSKVTDQMVISEANFARLQRSMQGLADAEVGDKSFAMNLGVSFALGVGKGSEIKVGGGIKYGGSVNLQDDRRLRVTHSMGVYGSGSAELAGVIGGSIGAEIMRGTTEVFMDVDHWAAVMAYRFSEITKEIKTLDDTQQLVEDELDAESADEVLSTSRLAGDGVTKVKSLAASGSIEASALGIGVGGSYEKKKMEFSKAGQTEKKQAKQSTKSVTISPGSNVSVSITRSIIDGHANQDNDGKYWNIKISLSGSASASLTAFTEASGDPEYGEWETRLREIMGADPAPSGGGGGGFGMAETDLVESASAAESNGHFGDIVSAVSTYLGAEVAKIEASIPASFDLSASLSGSKSASIEWNYVYSDATGHNELQYRRTGGGKGLSGSVSAPVGTIGAATATIDVGGSKSSSGMVSEKLGDSTLTYWQTVYNGLSPRTARDARLGRARPDQWAAYLSKHSKEVWSTLCKMGAGAGGAHTELMATIASDNTTATQAAPSGTDATAWADVQAKAAAARDAGRSLKAIASGNVGLADAGTVDPGKFATVTAALSTFLAAQGALDNTQRKLEWS